MVLVSVVEILFLLQISTWMHTVIQTCISCGERSAQVEFVSGSDGGGCVRSSPCVVVTSIATTCILKVWLQVWHHSLSRVPDRVWVCCCPVCDLWQARTWWWRRAGPRGEVEVAGVASPPPSSSLSSWIVSRVFLNTRCSACCSVALLPCRPLALFDLSNPKGCPLAFGPSFTLLFVWEEIDVSKNSWWERIKYSCNMKWNRVLL
jgi:hypothetical protein